MSVVLDVLWWPLLVWRGGHRVEVNIRRNGMESLPGPNVAVLDRWPLVEVPQTVFHITV